MVYFCLFQKPSSTKKIRSFDSIIDFSDDSVDSSVEDSVEITTSLRSSSRKRTTRSQNQGDNFFSGVS